MHGLAVLDRSTRYFKPPYKKTHVNHPCARWARQSRANYAWLCELGVALCDEYTLRYGRVHKTHKYLTTLAALSLPIEASEWCDPPQAMDERYRRSNTVTAYRTYYTFGKAHLHAWTKRRVPNFCVDGARRCDDSWVDRHHVRRSIPPTHQRRIVHECATPGACVVNPPARFGALRVVRYKFRTILIP